MMEIVAVSLGPSKRTSRTSRHKIVSVFCPADKSVYNVRVEERINVGIWARFVLTHELSGGYALRKHYPVDAPADAFTSVPSLPLLSMSAHVCFRWSKDGNGAKIFVGCLEFGDVLISHIKEVEKDAIYKTKVRYVSSSPFISYGHFVSDDTLDKIRKGEADKIRKTMTELRDPSRALANLNLDRCEEDVVEGVCVEVAKNNNSADAIAHIFSHTTNSIITLKPLFPVEIGLWYKFMLRREKRGGVYNATRQDTIGGLLDVKVLSSDPYLIINAHVCFGYRRPINKEYAFVACVELGEVVAPIIPGVKLDCIYFVRAHYVDGSDVVKDAHFICESEISIIGDHENEKFMSNLSGNLENFEDVSKGGSPDLGDGATRAVVLDLAPDPKGGGSLFECFSYDEKRVIMISTNVGLCRSWRIRFWVTAIEPDGVHEVQVQSDNIDASQSADVVLGRDGVVRMRTYVGISRVMYHDSHDGITLWSSLCGRVLNGEHEKMRENEIYSTFVHRDKSELARRNGVEFRKCDLSKRVPSDDVWRAYRDQMLKEQDDWLDKTHLPIREPPDKVVQYLGQSSFGVQIGAQFDTQRSERERRYQRRRNMRGNLLPNWRKAVSEVSYRGPLMLCVDDGRDAAAWSPDFGIVCIESPVLQRGCEILEKGQWFYANMRTVENKKQPELSYCFVKRPDSLAYPLAYTMCSYRYVEIEAACGTDRYTFAPDGRAIVSDHSLGHINMTRQEAECLVNNRIVCRLRFTFDPKVPWKCVEFLRRLDLRESFPMGEPECFVSDFVRHSLSPRAMRRLRCRGLLDELWARSFEDNA